jgi:hypothetical protein
MKFPNFIMSIFFIYLFQFLGARRHSLRKTISNRLKTKTEPEGKKKIKINY